MTATGVKSWQSCAKIRCSALPGALVEERSHRRRFKRSQDWNRERSPFANARRNLRHHSRLGNLFLASPSAKGREFAASALPQGEHRKASNNKTCWILLAFGQFEARTHVSRLV